MSQHENLYTSISNNNHTNIAAIIGTGNLVHDSKIEVIGVKYTQLTSTQPAKRLPELWNIPLKNINFIGRVELLKQIKDHYSQKNTPAILTACYGLGGVGKTQVALEFVWQHYKEYKGVVWFDAENRDRLQNSYISLGRELNIIRDEEKKESKELTRKVKHWLEDDSRAGWLLVYDNAFNYESIRELLPVKEGNLLVTSRYSAGWPQENICVNVFTIEESRAYVQKVLGSLLSGSDATHIDKLAEVLGGLPLALAQASAFIKMNKITISRYLVLYDKRKQEFLSEKKSILSDELLSNSYEQSQFTSVYITWDITMDAVSRESLLAKNWLNTCACLASDDIPNLLLEEFANIKENNPNSEIFEKAMGTLDRYSMLALNEKTQSASIHRLVQEVIQLKWEREKKENIVIDTFQLLKKCFPRGSNTLNDYAKKRQLLPHLEAFFRYLDIWKQEASAGKFKIKIEKNYLRDFLLWMAETYIDLRNFQKARELYEQTLPIFENHYSPDHPELAATLSDLGFTYGELGNFQKARELLEKSLLIGEKHHGTDHHQVSTTLNYLSRAYMNLGNTQKARELLERALPIHIKHYGPDHPEVAILLKNLGLTYKALGNAPKACELLERTLLIREKHYDPDHPHVATALHDLGTAYKDLGKFQKACELLKRALPIYEKHYGSDHFYVAVTLNSMGLVYKGLGNAQKACELLKRALPIYEKHYGPDHFYLAAALNSMGLVYKDLRNAQKACELIERALLITEKHYGPDHPEVATTLNILGNVYMDLGNAQKAGELIERALLIREKHYGPDHPEDATIVK